MTKKINRLIVYRVFLVIYDILAVIASSLIAVHIRFEFTVEEIPVEYYASVRDMRIWCILATLVIFTVFRLYHSLWRYASTRELINIIWACLMAGIAGIALYFTFDKPIFRSYFFVYSVVLFLFTCAIRFSYRLLRMVIREHYHTEHMRHTMIIGAGEACNILMRELRLSQELDAKVYCIIDDDEEKQGTYMHGVRIAGGRDVILECAAKYQITEIIVAMPSASKEVVSQLLDICQKAPNCELKILPGVYQLVNGEVSVSDIRDVEIEDLLGREVTALVNEEIGKYVTNKVVLVTGGGGSIGSELCRQIAANSVRRLIILDVYENNAYEIQQELRKKYVNLDLVVLIGSVRNGRKLESVFRQYRPNIVFHAAAHKHVPLMETSPNEAIKNNVFGTYKTAYAADKYGVEKFVLISTDKAVNPTNIMGASKRMCEMVIQTYNSRSNTEFVAVRFGNVLGSNGSVIPLFKKQIAAGGPVTVTHPDIIRYFMTIPEAVSLVLQAGGSAKGGEIFVLDMGEPVKIDDLAKKLIQLSGYKLGEDIQIQYTGLRPGEKLYEELLMSEEGLEATENKLIHIGKPIPFDEDEFLVRLDHLYREAYAESEYMKQIVHEIVPTYTLRPEDIRADRALQDTWQKDFVDTGANLPHITGTTD